MVNLKEFSAGAGLRYPITISKILKQKGEQVRRQDGLIQYTYRYKRTIGDPDLGEEREIEETGFGDWDCPSAGKIYKWHVKEGDVVRHDQVLVGIDEPCPHSEQIMGLCSLCGEDMTLGNWAADTLDTDRATISMVHDNVALKVSVAEAEKKELELQARLLKERKLSLVVDLDQTIIHACVEPTIRDWQSDPANPNYEAVKDVRSFELDDGPKQKDQPKCSYFIKMRPGLAEFLERMSELYEMHVYTMGTRAYAQEIAKIVDPDMKYFANRIISRDENGSLAAKRLQRLFPVSTHMVVVIDDRADVWPMNRSNLIKVTPYDFFKGIGDINSSFLPRREDIISPSPVPTPIPINGAGAAGNSNGTNVVVDAPEQERTNVDSNDENALLQFQAQEQEKVLEKQLVERPLLHLQEELDKEDVPVEPIPSVESSDATRPNGYLHAPLHPRHNLLRDDDEELLHLERHLTTLHQNFYTQHDSRVTARQKETGRQEITADSIPDVGKLLEWIKKRVLRGCSIVLSGLVPLGIDVQHTELGLQILSFGGEIRTRISHNVTHLVISSSRPRTQKVRQAARIPSIRIVNQDWLAGCLAQWKQLDVKPFLIDIHPADRAGETPVEESGRQSTSASPPGRDMQEEERDSPMEESDGDEDAEEDDEDGPVPDVYGVMPTEPEDGERSPVENLNDLDWGDVNAEFDEFMGSDADDDSDSSATGTDTESVNRNQKRRLDDDDDDAASALAKKQKLARDRTTGLRNVSNVGEDYADKNGLPTPLATGNGDDHDAENGDSDLDFDLEAELEAELAADAEAE